MYICITVSSQMFRRLVLSEKLRYDTAGTSLVFLVQRSHMGHLCDGGVLPVKLLVKGVLRVQIVLIKQKVKSI